MQKQTKRERFQQLLWGSMVVVIMAVVVVVVYTNITLRSVEKNLPNTLLTELHALDLILVHMSQTMATARIAQLQPNSRNIEELREKVEEVHDHVVEMRDTYVTDNLVNASAFHGVVAPVVEDLRIWLQEGVSGYGPASPITLEVVNERITLAFPKLQVLKVQSQTTAQGILEQQRGRIEQFLVSANLMLVLVIVIVCCMVYLLVHQNAMQHREKIARNELQYQRDLFDSLLQNLILGVMVWDKDGTLLHTNKSFTDITGYGRDDLHSMQEWSELVYPDAAYRRQVTHHWRETVRRDGVAEYTVTCKSGEVKDIEFRATFLPDARILITLLDVTARNRDEQALRESREIRARSKKMESLGLLAGGVAHDLNNILSGIVSYPELMLLDLPEDHALRRPIEVMHDSGQKAAAIVQDLLTVARGVAVAKTPLNINTIIEEYLDSPEFGLVSRHHPGIAVHRSLAADLFNIRGSRAHIRKMLMNLVSNASEAMQDSGSLILETKNTYVDTPIRNYDAIREGEYVLLSVADQGEGIAADDLKRIFEPFYSKKVMGRSGTGLGLAVVWNVVQDHNGYINVESDEAGTRFDVYFPVSREIIADPAAATDLQNYRGSGQSVLVIDDVAVQREISSSMLKKLGYMATSVASGEEAVEYLQAHSVDLLLLDMIMDPGMNGRQTYAKVLESNPAQKAVIASGYAETEDVRETLRMGAGQYLKKPFSIQELGQAVYSVLHSDDQKE